MPARGMPTRFLTVFLVCAAALLLAAACGGDPATKASRDCPAYEEKPMTAEEQAARKQYIVQKSEEAQEVRLKYDDLFWRQPNVVSVGIGRISCVRTEGGLPVIGIKIRVTEKVDQGTLPEDDRIPDVIEGVPVEIYEGAPFEFLGGM